MNHNDKPILLKPELITFSALHVNGEHVLSVEMHTANLGVFVLPATPMQAGYLSDKFDSYCEQVAAFEATNADSV